MTDLWALATSDVLGLSSSGFSVLAYYLRPSLAPTLVPIRHVAQFFTAADGSDGRSRKRVTSQAASAAPPANLWFVARLLDAVEVSDANSTGGAFLEANAAGEVARLAERVREARWEARKEM